MDESKPEIWRYFESHFGSFHYEDEIFFVLERVLQTYSLQVQRGCLKWYLDGQCINY